MIWEWKKKKKRIKSKIFVVFLGKWVSVILIFGFLFRLVFCGCGMIFVGRLSSVKFFSVLGLFFKCNFIWVFWGKVFGVEGI